MDELALARQAGLPDALRVLLTDYPRGGWESHPRFGGLTSMWLDRHLMFRRLQGLLLAETTRFLDRGTDPRRFGVNLSRLGGQFVDELHGHHMVEDAHYFPMLAALDPRLAAGFDLLDGDHRAIDPLLAELVDHANAVLGDLDAPAPDLRLGGRLRETLLRFERLLDRHLTDEEELVVPVILAHPGGALG